MAPNTRNFQALIESVNGSPRYLGTVSTSTTVATQAVTPGQMYLLQPDAATYVHGAVDAAGHIKLPDDTYENVLTSGEGYLLAADEKWVHTVKMDETHIAFILGSGTGNVKVFELSVD